MTVSGAVVRRLPSVDWVAIAVGFASVVLQSWVGWAWAITITAIALPSILREVGILKDGDEYLRGVAHPHGPCRPRCGPLPC